MKKAQIKDLNEITELFKEVIHRMQSVGVVQWDDQYPTKSVFEKDILNGEMFILKIDDKIVGCISLNQDEVSEYKTVKWSKAQPAMIIHRVAIHSDYQGQGLSKKMVEFAYKYALEHNINYLKTDTSITNNQMNTVYIKLGFKNVGQIFSRGRNVPLNCYEKIL